MLIFIVHKRNNVGILTYICKSYDFVIHYNLIKCTILIKISANSMYETICNCTEHLLFSFNIHTFVTISVIKLNGLLHSKLQILLHAILKY